ncbi:hypothetical protein F5X97DRAFT_307929 [Nemania serpens]|nr:hypothetical protein F5X97DRAFT_307929 [Nemania serpens]
MSAALPAVVLDFHALGIHAHALASGLSQFASLPALNDPSITTKLNRLDAVTRDIDSVKQDLKQELKRDLTSDLTQSLMQALTQVITQSNAALRADLRADLNADLTREMSLVREDIKTLERRLNTNIAVRETNGFARTQNSKSFQPSHRLMPLHSVLTDTPIPNFPKSVSQFKRLTNATIVQILQELDDPFHKPDCGTLLEKRQRLAMLIGVSLSNDPVVLRPAADAAEAEADHGDDDHSDDDHSDNE